MHDTRACSSVHLGDSSSDHLGDGDMLEYCDQGEGILMKKYILAICGDTCRLRCINHFRPES